MPRGYSGPRYHPGLTKAQIWARLVHDALNGKAMPISEHRLLWEIANLMRKNNAGSTPPDRGYLDWMVGKGIIQQYQFTNRQSTYYAKNILVGYTAITDHPSEDDPIHFAQLASGAATPAPVAKSKQPTLPVPQLPSAQAPRPPFEEQDYVEGHKQESIKNYSERTGVRLPYALSEYNKFVLEKEALAKDGIGSVDQLLHELTEMKAYMTELEERIVALEKTNGATPPVKKATGPQKTRVRKKVKK